MDEALLLHNWEQEAQQPFQGWDFSYLHGRYHEERPPWSYDDHVRALLPGAASLLDMGTGGGEKLLEFQELFPPSQLRRKATHQISRLLWRTFNRMEFRSSPMIVK